MKCTIARQSHRGRRPSNQDRLGHWHGPESTLLVAADGMGGHAHGEYAAELALRYFGAAFRRAAVPRLAVPGRFLRATALQAHHALLEEARALGLEDTPRTTIVACVLQAGWAHWMHVGDSRLYLLRGGEVQARTVDHTLVQQLVDEGAIAPEDARGHPQRNRLLQCLGGVHAPVIDALGLARLEPNDVLLLCTDGFWEPLRERQFANTLDGAALGAALDHLARLALERAGAESDNVSAIALAWEDAPVPLEPGTAPGPRLEPAHARDDPATPDPDILRDMLQDVESDLPRMRRALRDAGGAA